MLGAKLENQSIRLLFDGGNDELNDVAGLVFKFHRQVLVPENGSRVLECLQKFSSGDAVVVVFADPGLEKTRDKAAHGAAAIDKILLHAADFSHVEMRLNRFAVCPQDGQR